MSHSGIQISTQAIDSFHVEWKGVVFGRPLDGNELCKLAEAFPSLVCRPGVRPFHAELLDETISDGGVEVAAWHAARLILHCHDSAVAWRVGRFNFFKAWGAWDQEHRRVFAEYCSYGSAGLR